MYSHYIGVGKLMIEVLYRIYEVAPVKEGTKDINCVRDFYSSASKEDNIELVMDCLICDDRDQFKDIIRSAYSQDIKFCYSRKYKVGDIYCIIIGEHCFNTEKYFNKVEYQCDNCETKVTTYTNTRISFDPYEIKSSLFGDESYLKKNFCSEKCKYQYLDIEKKQLQPNDEQEYFVTREMFQQNNVCGYIYKITKRSTGEFYIGKSMYVPQFRWVQHLKTERFLLDKIIDYIYEVLYVVKAGEKILEVELKYIKEYAEKYPEQILNVIGTKK